jgi:poly(3-hydroxybutyrate) depolymerase
LLFGLAARAWAVALVGSTQTPTPPPTTEPHYDVAVETRALAKPAGTYVLLTPTKHTLSSAKGFTLLICLHGSEDTAPNAAKIWLSLVNSRSDLLVAVPEASVAITHEGVPGFTWGRQPPTALVGAIIGDTVARDHVNPRQVIFVGVSQGGLVGSEVVGARPDLFAGYAGVATNFSDRFFTPALQKWADQLAVYYAVGSKDEDFKNDYAPAVAKLKSFGFLNLLTEQPAYGHVIASDEITRLMAFFDRMIKADAQRERDAAAVEQTLKEAKDAHWVVDEERPLNEQKGAYIFLSQDRTKFPLAKDATLLVCLPGADVTAADFAELWLTLVVSRRDVVVAVPEGSANTDLITSIIGDTVARDHVNPQQVILVGYDEGGVAAGQALSEHPELFAGLAGISTNFSIGDSKTFPRWFFVPELKSRAAQIAVYYAVGAKDAADKDGFAGTVAQLKSAGFTNIFAERPASGHYIPLDEFKPLAARLMTFFDRVWAANEQKARAAAAAKN